MKEACLKYIIGVLDYLSKILVDTLAGPNKQKLHNSTLAATYGAGVGAVRRLALSSCAFGKGGGGGVLCRRLIRLMLAIWSSDQGQEIIENNEGTDRE